MSVQNISYETIRSKIIIQLMPVKGNEEKLSLLPHRIYEDMAGVYRVMPFTGGFGISASFVIPGTLLKGMGMTEKDLIALFRDMGQEHNQDGSRSIYYDTQNKKYAMMAHLDAFSDRIDYIYYRSDNGKVTLSYYLENSRVTKMAIRCSFD